MLRLTFVLGLIATLGAGCRDRTQIMIGVATDLRAPDLLDEVELEVLRSGVPALGPLAWTIPGGRAELFALPGSYGIYSTDGSEPRVDVLLRGRKNGQLIVERRSIVSLVSGKTLFMRMGLVAACMNNVQCPSGQTCIEGACRDALVDARTLPAYKPELVTHLTCSSGTGFVNTEDNSPMPMLPGMEACGGPCSEGTCYEPLPDAVGDMGEIPQGLWTQQALPASAQGKAVRAVWTTTSGQVFAVGDGGLLLRLGANDGEEPLSGQSTWVDESLPSVTGDLYAVFGTHGGDVWAVGQGVILHRTSAGWETLPTDTLPQGFLLEGGVALDGADAWAVGRDAQGNALVARFNGDGWMPDSTFPGTGDLKAVTGVPERGFLAVGLGGQVWAFQDFEWYRVEIPEPVPDLYGIWIDPASQLAVAVGAGGTILSYDGLTTRIEESGTKEDLLAVWGTSPQNIFAVGRNGTILHSSGGGVWTQEPSPVDALLFGVFGSRHDNIYAVGDSGTVLHSGMSRGMPPVTDGGTTDPGDMSPSCGGFGCSGTDSGLGCSCTQTCTAGKREVICDGMGASCECTFEDGSKQYIEVDVGTYCADPQLLYEECFADTMPLPPE